MANTSPNRRGLCSRTHMPSCQMTLNSILRYRLPSKFAGITYVHCICIVYPVQTAPCELPEKSSRNDCSQVADCLHRDSLSLVHGRPCRLDVSNRANHSQRPRTWLYTHLQLSIHLPVCLSMYLPMHVTIYPCIYLDICLCIYIGHTCARLQPD